MSDSGLEQRSAGANNSFGDWLSSHVWESIKSIPAYEMQAVSDIVHGKGTLGEYAAVGLPLLAISTVTDGLGWTALKLSSETAAVETAALGATAVTTVNSLGLAGLGAGAVMGGLAARQFLVGGDK